MTDRLVNKLIDILMASTAAYYAALPWLLTGRWGR